MHLSGAGADGKEVVPAPPGYSLDSLAADFEACYGFALPPVAAVAPTCSSLEQVLSGLGDVCVLRKEAKALYPARPGGRFMLLPDLVSK